jgi:hypothetical protein
MFRNILCVIRVKALSRAVAMLMFSGTDTFCEANASITFLKYGTSIVEGFLYQLTVVKREYIFSTLKQVFRKRFKINRCGKVVWPV